MREQDRLGDCTEGRFAGLSVRPWQATLGALLVCSCLARPAAQEAASPRHLSEMVVLGPDDFVMGTGIHPLEPLRRVTVGRFAIDRVEVTVAKYRTFLNAGGTVAKSGSADCNLGNPAMSDHPVNCVSWDEAEQYCRWSGTRLPTEVEWEYAARGPEGREYAWGAPMPSATRMNALDQSCVAADTALAADDAPFPWNDGFCTTAPVGRYPSGATPQGVLDLAGNVWEWTSSDCLVDEPTCSESHKILRGGGFWLSDPYVLRAAVRRAEPRAARSMMFGFRCAKSLD